MSGRQRAYWTMSSPLAPDYNIAMQQFTNIACTTTTNQHKDSPEDSMKSDAADLVKISSKSVVWSPHFARVSVKGPCHWRYDW